ERPLILASASPRRIALLRRTMLPFESVPSRYDENGHASDPADLALELAAGKAEEVRSRLGANWILGADTLVVAGDEILGKPAGRQDAERMLRLLSGKEHFVTTGFVLMDPSGRTAHQEAPITRVKVKTLSEMEIAAYIATGEPFGKAGAYAVQGIGTFIVEEISGSYTNVVGLPVFHLLKALVATRAIEGFPLQPPTATL
ncbi:MAG TPA: septum formation protein Maf, partial [Desulfobacteraceae bacterium]|nr:septum formation protein Maf [Desulfobacteraceae bacterium]